MKRLLLVLLVSCLTAACQRKDDRGNPVMSSIPGAGVPSTTHYAGAISVLTGCGQSCTQTVAVNADVIDHPSDVVDVYLCKLATCSIGNIPAAQCSSVPLASQATTPCYTTIPFTDITLGHNTVGFVEAFQGTAQSPGYSSYAISTTVSR